MRIVWREIRAARNTYAVLFAACTESGYHLELSSAPDGDITCYSINSINEPLFREEIGDAPGITIVGGPHAAACYREVAHYADYVIVGEGEKTLPRLLDAICRGSTNPVPGVATQDGYTPADHTVLLDAYPCFLQVKGYLEISRGCPYACTYCQTPRIFGTRMRHRSLDSIEASARRVSDARFVTPNALAYGSDGRTPRYDLVEKLLKRLAGKRIWFGTFPSEVRPDWITGEALEMIALYTDNTRIHFGAQSGSDQILSMIQRGHTVADVFNAIDLCCSHGFQPVIDIIVGFPGETGEDSEETMELVRYATRFGTVHMHYFMPIPGTPLAGAHPSPLQPQHEKAFGSLALSGKVTGYWTPPERRFLNL
ncbi:MAG: TIGR04013 family B12-binding domain/radical SAM domain-containing protein [Methanocalculus sp. MSAO_Arc1]|uniref:TIGR04013 family B12-binding domain/radical SAM domain-containing protein n=1 Tax=Methanocalculus TaxID=71151 RepID=UPI000FF3D27C|nr:MULTISPECIES: TIGR04013 family B12-binding domain/radical SAM domain-containing protein [unclassified Methanocalculus]MCP1661946.1 B12-binding domain/radical SAM domain protein [Methanocalculus sp. AMF5]RQD80541.1 MAG: TIGR04013 family B12-binding domain/radical SAM domain-containing protein [Methanocalculus sp. MSAO_Arc1]